MKTKQTSDMGQIWKQDFPGLGGDACYLDTASTAQKPQIVIDKMTQLMGTGTANIHRGVYKWASDLTAQYEGVRAQIAKFINAASANEIVFTKNTTEAINLVAQSWGRANLRKGDNIILTHMEHHANIVPWQLLAGQIGFEIRVANITDQGQLDLDHLKSLLDDRTRFVGCVHVSNVLGTINPAEKICKFTKEFNEDIKVLFDGSQAVVHMNVDVRALNCDFYCFTGHKLYGPTGVGVLYGCEELLNHMPPFQGGGDMIETVSYQGTKYKNAPARFESGTPAIMQVIALGEGISYIENIGFEALQTHEDILKSAFESMIQNHKWAVPLCGGRGAVEPKIGVYALYFKGAYMDDVVQILDQMGIYCRTGHHCCMPMMEYFNIDGTLRVSFGLYNTLADIARLDEGLIKAAKMLGVSK